DGAAGVTAGVGRLLGVDWGERRIGLALSDESQTLAQPLATLTRRAGKRFPMQKLVALLNAHSVVGVVVGLPLDAAAAEGPAAAAARTLADGSPAPEAPTVTVPLPRGATFDAAVDSLVAHGVVTHPTTFHWYARLHGLPGSLKSGIYGFHADERWSELVDALKRGRGALTRWTVPEGLTLREIADLAQCQLRVPRDSLPAAAAAPALLAHLALPRGAG